MTNRLYGLILILSFSFTAGKAYSEVYKWVDEHGNVHFGDSKHADKQAEDISSALQQQNIDHSAKRTEKTLQQVDQRQQAQATEAQQRQNEINPNKEQLDRFCRDARQRLRIMQGPVAFLDENNQQVKVTETERQRRADALSKQIDKFCS